MQCPSCGATVLANQVFCGNCGVSLLSEKGREPAETSLSPVAGEPAAETVPPTPVWQTPASGGATPGVAARQGPNWGLLVVITLLVICCCCLLCVVMVALLIFIAEENPAILPLSLFLTAV